LGSSWEKVGSPYNGRISFGRRGTHCGKFQNPSKRGRFAIKKGLIVTTLLLRQLRGGKNERRTPHAGRRTDPKTEPNLSPKFCLTKRRPNGGGKRKGKGGKKDRMNKGKLSRTSGGSLTGGGPREKEYRVRRWGREGGFTDSKKAGKHHGSCPLSKFCTRRPIRPTMKILRRLEGGKKVSQEERDCHSETQRTGSSPPYSLSKSPPSKNVGGDTREESEKTKRRRRKSKKNSPKMPPTPTQSYTVKETSKEELRRGGEIQNKSTQDLMSPVLLAPRSLSQPPSLPEKEGKRERKAATRKN